MKGVKGENFITKLYRDTCRIIFVMYLEENPAFTLAVT